MLGRVALVHNDVKGTNDELRAAGASPGSPQLKSFGPNMSLARDFLVFGEKQAVLDYFDQVGTFWNMGTADLRQWTERSARIAFPTSGPAWCTDPFREARLLPPATMDGCRLGSPPPLPGRNCRRIALARGGY